MAPHSCSRNSFHLRPFNLPASSAARYFRPHPVALGPALTTTAVEVGFGGEETGGDDWVRGVFEAKAGLGAGAADCPAWASGPTPGWSRSNRAPLLFEREPEICKTAAINLASLFEPSGCNIFRWLK